MTECTDCGGSHGTLYQAPNGDPVCVVCYDKRSEEGEDDG